MLAGFERPSQQERQPCRLEDRLVTRALNIVRDRHRQPAAVVGDAGAHAAAAFRAATNAGRRLHETDDRQHATDADAPGRDVPAAARRRLANWSRKAIGTARLVETGTAPHPAPKHLVEQPPVKHDVHRPVRGCAAGPCRPSRCHMRGRAGQFGIEIGRAPAMDQSARSFAVDGLADRSRRSRAMPPGLASTSVAEHRARIEAGHRSPASSGVFIAGQRRRTRRGCLPRPINAARSQVQPVWQPSRSANAMRRASLGARRGCGRTARQCPASCFGDNMRGRLGARCSRAPIRHSR